jgi:hypothetical protein
MVLLIAGFVGFLFGAIVNDWYRGENENHMRLYIRELEFELDSLRAGVSSRSDENAENAEGLTL